ncbi:MAG: TIGR03546 family protein [Planctomycetota bacterium]|nr:TIGR03546 family protein [Planctomycetota bacterium]
MLWLIKQFLYLRKAITAGDTPRQLAAGVALGMMLGLLPKGNLLTICLSMTICACRVNIAVAMLSALAFSCVGMLADPLTNRLGLMLLQWDVLRPTWTSLYNLPLAPWTAFNNTVVLGSCLLGTLLCYPTYRLALSFFERLRARKLRHASTSHAEPLVQEEAVLAGSKAAA